jgi:hypothetical protein
MRPRDFRHLFAFLFLCPLAAQEPVRDRTTTVRFRAATLGHDVLLREGGSTPSVAALPAVGKFPLPPGGQELGLQPTTFTPYDRYFGSVREVVANLEPQRATMAEASHLMKVGYSFSYVTRDPYRPDPPKLTEAQRAGDCKSKALWLYDNLGDASALFVIGKAEKNLRTSHAWVYWRSGGCWWILDCTDRLDPIVADSVSSDRYVPYYSFGKNGTYRHPATKLTAAPDGSIAGSSASGAPVSDRKKSR